MHVRRVYEKAQAKDGYRILVDRLWPRGVKKEQAGVDLWLKEIAPSHELRRWFNHDPEKWQEFNRRYFQELDQRKDLVAEAIQYMRDGSVTLLYAAKDEVYNNAIALKEYLLRRHESAVGLGTKFPLISSSRRLGE